MLSDSILERTKILLEQYITKINGCVLDQDGLAEVAMPWSRQPVCFSSDQIPDLIRKTTNILQAQAHHACHAPHWATPLPLDDEIPPLLQSMSGPLCLLGHYARSLKLMRYNYRAHPSISTFGCGVMCHPATPGYIRDNLELQEEFPAAPLPGLDPRLVWSGERLSPEVRAEVLGR